MRDKKDEASRKKLANETVRSASNKFEFRQVQSLLSKQRYVILSDAPSLVCDYLQVDVRKLHSVIEIRTITLKGTPRYFPVVDTSIFLGTLVDSVFKQVCQMKQSRRPITSMACKTLGSWCYTSQLATRM